MAIAVLVEKIVASCVLLIFFKIFVDPKLYVKMLSLIMAKVILIHNNAILFSF